MMRCLSAFLLSIALAGCGDARNHAQAVYVLVDTSGTFVQEANKAQVVVNYLLGTLQPGDSLAVARVENRSFSEKDIVAKATFDIRPSQANAQKRAFRDTTNGFVSSVKSSRYTDITGGLLQGAEFLNETGAGTKTDNIDPRRYFGRLEAWQKRVKAAGASEWVVINDLERLDAILGRR
jgi:hypothetical protein